MTIAVTDIKLMASQKLTDADDAGGRMSSVEIQDGLVNNIFPDISRLDRTYGRINLRKVFPFVDTANTDTYYGAHAIILENPTDPKIGTLLIEGTPSDTRLTAETRMEAYVTQSSESDMYLYGLHVSGSRQIKVWQNVGRTLPEIGMVYIMTEVSGSTVLYRDSILITSIKIELQSFEDANGPYSKNVITLGLSRSLVNSYTGTTPQRQTPLTSYTSHIYTTVANDSGRYYGTMSLSQSAAQGDLSVKASDLYGQLLPATQADSPLLGVNIPSTTWYQELTNTPVTLTLPSSGTKYLGSSIKPRTLRACRDGATFTTYDDGSGNFSGPSVTGTVNYEAGLVTYAGNANSVNFEFIPAATVTPFCRTYSIPINISNRGYNYPVTLNPKPSPKSLTIDYRALGRWYRLSDNGAGVIVGSSQAFGSGTVDYTTGNVLFTAGALPDADTAIIFSWGTPVDYKLDNTNANITAPIIRGALTIPTGQVINLTSITFTWYVGGVTKTATVDSTGRVGGSNVVGGQVNGATGLFYLTPLDTRIPDLNSNITVSYTTGTIVKETITPTGSSNGAITVNASNTGLVAGTVSMSYICQSAYGYSKAITLIDDGNGLMFLHDGSTHIGKGTVNYTTGVIQIDDITYPWPVRTPIYTDGLVTGWASSTLHLQLSPFSVVLSYRTGAGANAFQTATLVANELILDLTPDNSSMIVPGSVKFTWHGSTYQDDALGRLVRAFASDGTSTPAGTVNYSNGEVSITSWTFGSTAGLAMIYLVLEYGAAQIRDFVFRVPGSPLRSGSVYIQANLADGTLVTGQANAQGAITGDITGTVDLKSSVVSATCAQGMIASTLHYNAVVLVNLPLEKSILGIDAINLPQDGRVPIFRAGNLIVVHDTVSTTLSNPVSAGQVVTLPRDNLAEVVVIDALGAKVSSAKYSINLSAGTITFANPLDLSAYTQPLVARHRVEDMALCTDAQIDGTITISSALSRGYTTNSKVSSGVIFGDIYSREYLHFTQTTWTNVWSDVVIGSTPTAAYNWVLYPLALTNHDAIEERWALIFTSSTGGTINGETVGQIGTFTTSVNVAPTNPVTSQPYFTLDYHGFGAGWSSGNVLRFNTKGGHVPLWISRSIAMGAQAQSADGIRLQVRGDVA